MRSVDSGAGEKHGEREEARVHAACRDRATVALVEHHDADHFSAHYKHMALAISLRWNKHVIARANDSNWVSLLASSNSRGKHHLMHY
jgi:hypothetical protein